MLKQSLNYLENQEFRQAANEFQRVLDKAEDAFNRVQDFNKKVFCKRTAMFARFMIHTYSEEEKQFVPLEALPASKKKLIATSIHIDVDDVLEEFTKLKIPMTQRILRRGNKERQKNQDVLDVLLKSCLPIMWHHISTFKTPESDVFMHYLPEGITDAAKIALGNGDHIRVWKERLQGQAFTLKWETNDEAGLDIPLKCTAVQSLLTGDLLPKCITLESLLTKDFYFDSDGKPLKLGEGKANAISVYLPFLKDSFSLYSENQKMRASYNGTFGFHILESTAFDINNRNCLETLTLLPPFVRYSCVDMQNSTLAHGLCDNAKIEFIKYFLNNENAKIANVYGNVPAAPLCQALCQK